MESAPPEVIRRWRWESHGVIVAFCAMFLLWILALNMHPLPKRSH